MKKIYFAVSFILLVCASIASASEPLEANTELISQEQAREVFQAQLDKDDMPALLQAMNREAFSHANIVRVQQIIEEAEKEGLPTEPLTDKVYEGIAKTVDEDSIVGAVIRVRHRYAYAYRRAGELVVDADQEKILGNLIAGAYTAGLTEEECDSIMAALQTRTRSMNRSQAQQLNIETMNTARVMAHRDVSSETISDVLVTALDKSYQAKEMEEMQHTFRNRTRYGSAEKVAQQFSNDISRGLGVGSLGHNSSNGGGSDNTRDSNGGSGGAGGGGSNSSGNGGGGSNSGSGNSGNSGGGSNSGSGNSGNSGGGSSGGSGSSGKSGGGSGGGRGK